RCAADAARHAGDAAAEVRFDRQHLQHRGVEPNPAFPTSSVFRAGLASFAKIFANEHAAENIRMNNVLPGFVDNFPVKDDILKGIPMQRYGRVEEMGDLVAFLASE